MLFLIFAAILELNEGWRYTQTAPNAPRHTLESMWSEEFEPRADLDRWYRVTLPATLPPDAHLVFRSYLPSFELFIEHQRFYAFRDDSANGRLRLHSAALPRDAAGRTLFVHIHAGSTAPLFGDSPVLASRADVPRALVHVAAEPLHGDLEDVLVGIVLVVIGIASIVISRIRRSVSASALLWFGIFAGLYGLRLVVDGYLPLLLGISMRTRQYAETFISYAISAPGWMLARRLIGDGWKSTLRWQVWIFAIFAPVAIATDLLRGLPGSMDGVNNVLVIIGGTLILISLIAKRAQLTRELRVVLGGALIFLAFALINNLSALGILPIREFDETPGFIIFEAALTYAAVRMFVRGERERVAIEGELATAREIQQSILPTTMPSVRGLHFAARYEPASSVAGDVYDFIAVDDAHVGVIVADVAGHGVPAALIASMVKVATSSHARLANAPAALLTEVNLTLRRDVRRNFVTATYLWFDMDAHTVSVSNAGHAPPVLVRGDDLHDLGPHGILLGRFAVASYESATIAIQAGDRIAAWTDGIVEARNSRGEQFGEERLHAMLRSRASADEIVKAVHAWRVENDADDLTVVVIEVDS